ncbi:cysteine desufuration protein SufE [Picosynechococcus sp. PCC 7003]|uniref:SufE family protein n=1 Tax=Picosynechococcus sp. PCC 7003 TaxID=374981 RepID=UPI000810555F|nr:SufE family protein [Picosynechococcus sp. PCC 7003]ANV83805.1 cysteine desufuration protein SufE [Picosynechococcus sp. PCC 7003]
MPRTLPANLEKIVSRFKRKTDPKQKYQQLLWYANKLEPMVDSEKNANNKVHGCVSQVFITADYEAGKVTYHGDSDAQLVKGLVGLLITGLNGLSPAEILAIAPDFIEETGLNVSLTPSRANGFYNIFKMMQKKAKGFEVGLEASSNS